MYQRAEWTMRATGVCGVQVVWQFLFAETCQPFAMRYQQFAQRRYTPSRDGERSWPCLDHPIRGGWRHGQILLEHDMRVGAAESERTNARYARQVAALPIDCVRRNNKRRAVEVDVRIKL